MISRFAHAALGMLAIANASAAIPLSPEAALARHTESNFSILMADLQAPGLNRPEMPYTLRDLFEDNASLPEALRRRPGRTGGMSSHLSSVGSQLTVCLTTGYVLQEEWSKILREVDKLGWTWADGTECTSSSLDAGPRKFPARLSFRKVLDAENVPTRTSLSANPQVSLPEGSLHDAVTLPSFTLTADSVNPDVSAETVIVLLNTNEAPDPGLLLQPETVAEYHRQWELASIKLNKLQLRPEVTAEHSCSKVGPQQQCSIALSFSPEGKEKGSRIPASLFLDFGEVSRIGFEAVVR